MTDENMKKILEAISGVNQRLDGVDKRLDNIDSKLDSVVIKVVSHDTALGQLVTKKEFAKFRDKNLELLDHIVGRLDVLSEEFQVLQAA